MKFFCQSVSYLILASGACASPIISYKKDGERLTVVDDADRGNGPNKFETSPGSNGVGHNLVFTLSPGRVVRIFSSPRTEELSIHLQGVPGPLTQEERVYLNQIKDLLESDADVNTDTIDSAGGQGRRAAGLLAEWPDTLDINYVLDVAAENARAKELLDHLQQFPAPADAPVVPGARRRSLRDGAVADNSFVYDEKKHPNRRLADLSLCPYMYNFVEVTHDDWN